MDYFIMYSFHDLGWDESVYLGMGKYIYSSGEIGLWEEIRPTLLPLFLGVFWKLDLPYIFFSDIIMLMFSVGVIYFTYKLSEQLFSDKSEKEKFFFPMVSIILLVGSSIFSEGTFLIHTGIPSVFFILFALYLFVRPFEEYLSSHQNLYVVGLLSGLAFLTRFPAGLIIVPLIFFIVYDHFYGEIVSVKQVLAVTKKLFMFMLGFLTITLPFFAANVLLYKTRTVTLFESMMFPFVKASLHQ